MNERMGMLCRMSSSGSMNRSAVLLAAAIFAYARLNTNESAYASDILSVDSAA